MTMQENPQPNPTAPPKAGRGIKIALTISVALNLAVAGLVGGLAIHGGGGSRGDMMVREMGFGPYDGALSPQDRNALRKAVQGRFGDVRKARAQMQADGQAVIAALRADPFQKSALEAAFAAQSQHFSERLNFGNEVIRDYLAALSPEERLAFADRLERRMHFGRDGDGDGKGKSGD